MKIFFFLTVLLSVIVVATGCKKDEPTLTGKWNMSFTITSTFTGTLTLNQDKDDKLTGNFKFSDGSGIMTLLSSSRIYGNTVTMEMMIDVYRMVYDGTINSDFTSMNGEFYSDGLYVGPWSATKTGSNKRELIGTYPSASSDKERLIRILSEIEH